MADLDRAIELNPGFAAAYWSRGLAYKKQGDHAQAEADFAKAKELTFKAT